MVVVVILLSYSVLLSKHCQFPHDLNWKLDEAVVLLVGSFDSSISLTATTIVRSQSVTRVSHKRASPLLWSLEKETRRLKQRDRLTDAHFANQIGQKTIRTPNAVALRGLARQYGSGGLGAFAMRMGCVAIPLVKQYVMPVAKEFGKNLLSFVPEISNVISGGKRP